MSQPPHLSPSRTKPPDWRRPQGVASGTWAYTHERSIADHYDAFVADTPLCKTDQSILAELFPTVQASPATWIVDLGCGSGRSALPLAARGYRVVGVDLSQSMLEVLRRKPLAEGYNVAAIRANLVELDCFASGSFDHAICMFSTLGMIQGREHRRQFLGHVANIVKPGGRFVFHVHHRWAALGEPGGAKKLASSWLDAKRFKDREFGDATYAYRGIEDMFMHRFSQRELRDDLNETGWTIESVQCLSTDGSIVMKSPLLMRHRVGGFIISARSTHHSTLK